MSAILRKKKCLQNCQGDPTCQPNCANWPQQLGVTVLERNTFQFLSHIPNAACRQITRLEGHFCVTKQSNCGYVGQAPAGGSPWWDYYEAQLICLPLNGFWIEFLEARGCGLPDGAAPGDAWRFVQLLWNSSIHAPDYHECNVFNANLFSIYSVGPAYSGPYPLGTYEALCSWLFLLQFGDATYIPPDNPEVASPVRITSSCNAAEYGGCCFHDGSCAEYTLQETCEPFGDWHGGKTCSQINCEPSNELEACCVPGVGCVDMTQQDCIDMNGEPQGQGNLCGDQGVNCEI